MEISKLLEKENAKYWGNLIKRSANGILIMIFIAVILIAIVVDTKLTNTFPAWSLITLIICLFVFATKIYINRREDTAQKKQFEIFLQQEYDFVKPMLNHLSQEEKDLIKGFIKNRTIDISFEEKIKFQQILAKGFYKYISVINYPGLPEPFDVAKANEILRLILKKYFIKDIADGLEV